MKGKILVFALPEGEHLEKIRKVAGALDMEVRSVLPGEYGNTVGQIAMLPPGGRGDALPLTEPMLVLCMPMEKLETVLGALRQSGLPPMCKAVLTATNATWTPLQLLTELQRERAEFERRRNRS